MIEFWTFRWFRVWPWIQISDISFPFGIYLDSTAIIFLATLIPIFVGMIVKYRKAPVLSLIICGALIGLVVSESIFGLLFFLCLLTFLMHWKFKISLASLLGDLGFLSGFLILYSESNGLTEWQPLMTWMNPDKFLGTLGGFPYSNMVSLSLWMGPCGKSVSILIYLYSWMRSKSSRFSDNTLWLFSFALMTVYLSYRNLELMTSFPTLAPIALAVIKVIISTVMLTYGFTFLRSYLSRIQKFDSFLERIYTIVGRIFVLRWIKKGFRLMGKPTGMLTEGKDLFLKNLSRLINTVESKSVYQNLLTVLIALTLFLIWVSMGL